MLKLPNELVIMQVETLHQSLLQELDSSNDICLDVSAVISVDTASIQLLCALQKYLLTIHQKITWVGNSDALSQGIEQLGLNQYLTPQNNK